MKKIFVLIVLLFLAVNVFGAAAASQGLPLRVNSTTQTPETVRPGDEIVLAVTLHNRSKSLALTDVKINLVLGENFSGENLTKEDPFIGTDQKKTYTYKFSSNEGILGGTYSIPLALEYDEKGRTVYSTETVSVKVSDSYDLEVFLSSTDPSPHIGEEVEIVTRVKNIGSREARNVSVKLSQSGQQEFSDFVLLSATDQTVGNIEIGETKRTTFVLKPANKITPGLFSFDVNATCLDCGDPTIEKITLDVLGKPDLIVSGIDFSVENVPESLEKTIMLGSAFAFSIQIDNIGEEDAKAVEVSVLDNDVLLGAKTSYIGNIETDDSGAAIFDLIASGQGLQLGENDLTIKISFINESNEKESVEQTYKLFVHARPIEFPFTPVILLIILAIVLNFTYKNIFRFIDSRKKKEQ